MCSTPSEFVSFKPSHHFYCLRVCLILLYVLSDIYLLWHEGCVGFWTYVPCLLSFPWTGRCLGEGPVEPMFFLSCVCVPLGYWSCHITLSRMLLFLLSFYFLLPRGLTGLCSYSASPLLYQSFTQSFLSPLSISLPLLGFIGNISTVPVHFIISFSDFLDPFTSSLPLLLSWAFC